MLHIESLSLLMCPALSKKSCLGPKLVRIYAGLSTLAAIDIRNIWCVVVHGFKACTSTFQ
jgi:hypothetical protein